MAAIHVDFDRDQHGSSARGSGGLCALPEGRTCQHGRAAGLYRNVWETSCEKDDGRRCCIRPRDLVTSAPSRRAFRGVRLARASGAAGGIDGGRLPIKPAHGARGAKGAPPRALPIRSGRPACALEVIRCSATRGGCMWSVYGLLAARHTIVCGIRTSVWRMGRACLRSGGESRSVATHVLLQQSSRWRCGVEASWALLSARLGGDSSGGIGAQADRALSSNFSERCSSLPMTRERCPPCAPIGSGQRGCDCARMTFLPI